MNQSIMRHLLVPSLALISLVFGELRGEEMNGGESRDGDHHRDGNIPIPHSPGFMHVAHDMGKLQKIVNGVETDTDEFPWMVMLRQEYPTFGGFEMQFCGGSLIYNNPIVVLSAAHCFDGLSYSSSEESWLGFDNTKVNIWADIGRDYGRTEMNGDDFDSYKLGKNSKYLEIHENWNSSNLQGGYDIALMVFPDDSDSSLELVDMPDQKSMNEMPLSDGDELVAIGYGLNASNGTGTKTLERTELKYVTPNDCSTMVGTYFNVPTNVSDGFITNPLICAKANNTDTCQGDSGGPLFKEKENNDEMDKIFGITSFGWGCNIGVPGVYTSVAHYIDWIEDAIDDATKDAAANTHSQISITLFIAISTAILLDY